MKNKIQLTLELSEVNQVLAALGKLRYEEVYGLIEMIKQQAHQQLEQDTKPKEPLKN
jgi:methyl coenzyme M reductase gamma subunit